ncbi:GNAT family N-acetyltransferase [Ornithinibacillus halophilus]|uniref:N-acetyltransferase domain-containing protein n=1 Tax=Ornithinibacillus halophilus TaxID=930117 RepID=A0A1M5LDZ9_9BACI|nr:hypothetical protein [Ornithinibacillus halophilus]SHG63206.1 hypothetical protein SAMN05216225_104619 [Ornithinibacillus halophilus]
MNIIAANKASLEKVNAFLETTDQVDKNSLLEEGFVVEFEQEIRGCFVLSSINEGEYWLKQLYISKEAAASLPVLLETIVTMAKGLHAKKVYVHSHQPVVDILLDALQFHPQKEVVLPIKKPRAEGSWWAYEVS